ncbi:unnamed protein product [Discosporangium mesarthrocarpum]
MGGSGVGSTWQQINVLAKTQGCYWVTGSYHIIFFLCGTNQMLPHPVCKRRGRIGACFGWEKPFNHGHSFILLQQLWGCLVEKATPWSMDVLVVQYVWFLGLGLVVNFGAERGEIAGRMATKYKRYRQLSLDAKQWIVVIVVRHETDAPPSFFFKCPFC